MITARQVTVLGGVALAAVALTALVLQTSPTRVLSDRRGEPVFAGLIGRANDVASIAVRDNQKTFVAERGADGFVDKESGYPVKAEAFRDIITGAISLTYQEAKTADPKRYADLGLAEPGKGADGKDAGDKAAREVTLRDAKGGVIASFFVGARETSVGGASGGQYIRLPGAPQTWLVRGVTNVPAPHAAWFDINIVNFSRDALERMDFTGGGLDDVALVSEKKGDDLKLANPVPEGRKADANKALRAAFLVDPISFEEVRKPAADSKTDGRKLTVTGRDGLKMTIQLVGKVEDGWARISFEGTNEESKKRAEELQKKVAGFEFKLIQRYADSLGWKLEDFTEPVKS